MKHITAHQLTLSVLQSMYENSPKYCIDCWYCVSERVETWCYLNNKATNFGNFCSQEDVLKAILERL